MPVNWSELLSVFGVLWCCLCVSAVQRKPKSVVFSYASAASHPHVATLSHHYRAPPEPQSQQYMQPKDGHSQSIPPSAGQNIFLPHPGNVPPPLSSQSDQHFQPEIYPEHFNQHSSLPRGEGIPHYDNYNSEIYQSSIGSPTPHYDYTSISPHGHESSTLVYNNHQPLDNRNYDPHHASEPPLDYDHRLYDQSTVNPDLVFQSTPVYYNDRPSDNSPSIQPPYHDRPQGYDHYSNGFSPTYNDDPANDHRHPQPLQHNDQEQFYEHSTAQPVYPNTNSPNHYDTPQHSAENPLPESSLTFRPPSHQYTNANGSLNQNFPDYEAPASPEYLGFSSQHPPRGAKTFSPLPPSSTQVYYEDEVEYVSTTPIIEFESVKQELPPIADYPLPKPGYITKPFEKPFSQRKNMDNQEQPKGWQSKGSDKMSMVHHSNDKVLQKPKFFAYSTDLSEEHSDTDSGIEHVGDHSDENIEKNDHEKKKKDEKYVKGGGQEHHSAHKAVTGDKGDKGYKSEHKHDEGKKGHHEKEDHRGKYVDEKGKKGKKEEEGGHYGEHHKAEKGKKATKFGESGEHKKGHSTKGEHNIHKMDEYMKKHEFYDEHHEGGDHEKFGGFMEAHAHKKGGKKKKGHHKGGHLHKHKGKKGHHEKGHKLGQHKGHKDAKGYDGHFSKHKKYGKKGGNKKGKKWSYSNGHPPK